MPAGDSGKRIWLTFDGVFRDATVWVNGWLVRRHEGGYYPFREDITDVVHFGGKNTIAVRVDATKSEGWFYEGAGIYRHVWLDKTAPVAIAPDGIFVYSTFSNNVPEGPATIQMRSDCAEQADEYERMPKSTGDHCRAGRQSIAESGAHQTSEVAPNSETKYGREIGIRSPVLWSPETPKLYKLVTTVSVDGKVVDQTGNRRSASAPWALTRRTAFC